jgi:hypothetical protein
MHVKAVDKEHAIPENHVADAEKSRSSGSGSSSSNRSVTSSRRVRSHETLLAHTESDESSDNVDGNSRASSPGAGSDRKAFDVISIKSNPSRCDSLDAVSSLLNLHSPRHIQYLLSSPFLSSHLSSISVASCKVM